MEKTVRGKPHEGTNPTSDDRRMKTEFVLLAHYERPTVTLEQLADFFQVTPRTMENMIYENKCPLVTFKIGNKWHAHVSDMAAYIDAQRAEALKAKEAANDRHAA